MSPSNISHTLGTELRKDAKGLFDSFDKSAYCGLLFQNGISGTESRPEVMQTGKVKYLHVYTVHETGYSAALLETGNSTQ